MGLRRRTRKPYGLPHPARHGSGPARPRAGTAELRSMPGAGSGVGQRLGGNLMIIGERPDGDPFKFGLREPQKVRQHLPWHCNAAVWWHHGYGTGGYERYFEEDDPANGYGTGPQDRLSGGQRPSERGGHQQGRHPGGRTTTPSSRGWRQPRRQRVRRITPVDQDKAWISGPLRGNFEPHEQTRITPIFI